MKKVVLITLLLLSTLSKSQDLQQKAFSFNMQEAIAFGLQNNLTAKNAGLDIEISKQKKWETTAIGLPQINAGVNYLNNIKIQKSVIPAEIFGGAPGTFAEVAFGTKHTMASSATLSQLIFDGSYIVALEASKVYLQYYVNAKKKTDAEIREMITNSYGNVLLADESIKVLNRNKIVLEKNLNDAEQIFKNGLGEQETAEQIAITLTSVKSNLNNIIRLRELSLNMLKLNLGLEIANTLTLTDNLDDLSKNNFAQNLTSDFKVTNNIDYQIVNSLVTQKKLFLKLERAKALPSMGANLNFGYNAFSQEFSFFGADQRWFNYSNIGVGLNIPIFSSFKRRAVTQQAKIEVDKAKIRLVETEQILLLQHQKSKSDFEFSIEEYATSKSNLALAERIEKKQQIKFKEGLSTSFEFSEAQRQLYAAQQQFLQSMANIINKRAALEKLNQ